MDNFDFYAPTRIIFGRNTQDEIGALLKPHASKVLLHYGGGSIKRSGLIDRITASLRNQQIEYVQLGGVVPNPRLSLVHEGVELCRKEQVDLILAVGGGSVIDSAKAIAMGMFYDGDIWDVYDGRGAITKALPVATVLTIPAAGSEASSNTVITNEETQQKVGFGSPLLRPLLSVVNPELFYTLPKDQIANGVSDMMSHIFERYFTNTIHTDVTDGLCESVLKTIMKNAPRLMEDAQDYDAWCEIGFAGTIAHNGLLGMGRREDWGCHAMEHQLSALYDVAHGAGLAVVTPAWMQYVYRTNINMFVQFAVNVMGVEASFRDPEAIIQEGIARLQRFYKTMELPTTLPELGIGKENLERMAKMATNVAFGEERPIGGLKKLSWQDVLAIYNLAR